MQVQGLLRGAWRFSSHVKNTLNKFCRPCVTAGHVPCQSVGTAVCCHALQTSRFSALDSASGRRYFVRLPIYIYIHIWSYIYKGTIIKTRFCRGSASMSWPIFLDNSTRISEGEGGQGFKTPNCLIGALLGFYKGLPLLDLLAGETT